MKPKISKFIFLVLFLFAASCGEPETVVTDIVRPDGSVTRRLEMRNTENKFEISKIQVPFDSTWSVRDSLEVNEQGDTTFVKRAEKLYSSVSEINRAYSSDSGANKDLERRAEFSRKFKWFNTVYRYSETIEKTLRFGYPVTDFLDREELLWFYSNGNVAVLDMRTFKPDFHGGIIIDSLEYKSLDSLVRAKTDEWSMRNLISEWANTFSEFTGSPAENGMSMDSLKKKEDLMLEIISRYEDDFDTLWEEGTILKELIGDTNARKYKAEADSALNIVLEKLFIDFSGFDQRIIMPGKLIGGNGFSDSTEFQRWSVKSDFFMTEPYVMFAESKVTNWWAWILSGVFVAFVFSGIIFRKIKKG